MVFLLCLLENASRQAQRQFVRNVVKSWVSRARWCSTACVWFPAERTVRWWSCFLGFTACRYTKFVRVIPPDRER